jgi:5'-deoxynucleotidase YfbR-like HD superfamily hydrolase
MNEIELNADLVDILDRLEDILEHEPYIFNYFSSEEEQKINDFIFTIKKLKAVHEVKYANRGKLF